MTQAPLHTLILVTGALVGGCCLMVSACSKPTTAAATTTTTVATTQPHPTLVAPPVPAISAASDVTQTAAVTKPGKTDGALPATPGERETVAAAEASPRD